jgi:hypothetical protein
MTKSKHLFFNICKTLGRIRMRTGIVLMPIRILIWIGIINKKILVYILHAV